MLSNKDREHSLHFYIKNDSPWNPYRSKKCYLEKIYVYPPHSKNKYNHYFQKGDRLYKDLKDFDYKNTDPFFNVYSTNPDFSKIEIPELCYFCGKKNDHLHFEEREIITAYVYCDNCGTVNKLHYNNSSYCEECKNEIGNYKLEVNK